jgi:hypothetical protein
VNESAATPRRGFHLVYAVPLRRTAAFLSDSPAAMTVRLNDWRTVLLFEVWRLPAFRIRFGWVQGYDLLGAITDNSPFCSVFRVLSRTSFSPLTLPAASGACRRPADPVMPIGYAA